MTNDTNYRGKANAVFFAAVMVISMVAAGFAAAPAAAAVSSAGTAQDLTVGVDDTQHTISGINVDTTGDVNISVSALTNTDVDISNVDNSNISTTDGTGATGTPTFSASTGNITVPVNTAGTFDVTVSGLDTSAASPTSGISYTVTDVSAGDSATTSFDLVGAEDLAAASPVVASNVNSNDAFEVLVDHPTSTSPDEVTVFALGPQGGTATGSTTSTGTDSTRVSISSFTEDIEAGDEIQIHAVAASGVDANTNGGSFVAGSSTFQVQQNITVSPDPDVAPVASGNLDGQLYYTGQTVAVDLSGTNVNAGENVNVRLVQSRDNNGNPVSTSQARSLSVGSNNVIVIDTSRLRGEGDYVLQNDGNFLGSSDFSTAPNSLGSDITEFELLNQDLSAQLAADEATNNEKVDVDVESLRGNFNLEVSGELDGDTLSESELENIFDDAGATGLGDGDDDTVLITGVQDGEAFTANFTDVEGGDYSFDFNVEDTDAADSDSINVSELGDGELTLAGNGIVTQQQGDVANITVAFEGDASTGTLVVGDEADVGYQGNITIDSGGEDEVSVLFNSYAAGSSGNGTVFQLANPDDTDASLSGFTQNTIPDILADGDYTISVSTSADYGTTLNDPDTIGTLVIEQRETTNQQIWTASDNTISDITDADDPLAELTSQIEGNNVTQTSTIAEGDQVIHQIEASGLTGLLDSYDADATTALANAIGDTNAGIGSDAALDLRVRQTQDSTTANQPPARLESNILGNVTVLEDEDTDNYYLVYDIDDTSAEDGEEFNARFRVQDQRLLNPSDTDLESLSNNELRNEYYQSVTSTFDVAAREFEFDQDPYNVTNAEGQVVSGTSNVAPGTEVNVRLRSASGTTPSFIDTAEGVRVNADGTWSTEFDFSETSVGDEYSFTVQQTGLSENPSVEGTVVEQVEESATFTVSELDPQDVTATVGDALTVTATVENTGNAEATQTVEFRVGGDAVASQDVTLEAGSSTTVEFADVDTSGLDAGEY
ncbi:hypothetical protein EXE43_18330, partial [Halorubrum sp. SS5]